MKYKTEELEKMSKEDLLKTYRDAKKSVKKDILISLANSGKFAVLMGGLYSSELLEMAKIHPFKEVVIDTMIDEIESHGVEMAQHWKSGIWYGEKGADIPRNFESMEKALTHKSVFDRIKETFSRKKALPEQLPQKIEQVKKLFEIEQRRTNATGKKMEELESQSLDQPLDKSRVEVNNGEMAKVFDRFAKEARKEDRFFGWHGVETETAQKLKAQLTEEYMSTLGAGKEDIARLVAMKEFESYSGESYYVPYSSGNFGAKSYDNAYNQSIGGVIDNRGWQKNLLEVEQVQDFTVGEHNLGEIFIIKSEFSPTSYAIEGKWAPIYEYYTKDENGEMVRIGSGKFNKQTGKMETTISIDGQDRSTDIIYDNEELAKAKEEGSVIKFDSSEYTGNSTKTSRKDIEQAITEKAIQQHLGKGKQIADITQVKDIPVVTYDQKGNPQTKNAYVVACVENGVETYEMVCIGEDGKCEPYPGMSQDLFAKKEMYFPTGMTTGYDKRTSLRVMDKKQALETFKSKEEIQYSVYRDKDGNLRVAQMIEHANGNGKYAEELDTYSVMHEDSERMKAQSKEEHDKALTLLKAKQEEKRHLEDNSLSL